MALYLHGKHAKPFGQAAPHVEGLLRDRPLLVGLEGIYGPHVMQAVRQLDQYDQRLVHHAEDEMP
eukprot:scaffold59114_cov25-Prasinocladus_malaysianus.AAC.1